MFFTALFAHLNRPVSMLVRSIVCSLLFTMVLFPALAGAADFALADRVVVSKGERKLFLMKDDIVLRKYDVSLGLLPEGDKAKEGDFRTPEGRYLLTTRNTDSEFFLSIKVSYPNEEDVRYAEQQGVDPGGQIMIHGYPNQPRHNLDFYRHTDWTDGCIAVTNSDMVEIWLMTVENTPVIITP